MHAQDEVLQLYEEQNPWQQQIVDVELAQYGLVHELHYDHYLGGAGFVSERLAERRWIQLSITETIDIAK